MIRLRILLQGGHVYETRCAADAPVLDELCKAVTKGGANGLAQLRIEQGGTVLGLAIPYSQIVAIETEPPFVLQPKAEAGIRQAAYIRIPEFLSKAENEAVMEYATRKQPDFHASSVEGGRESYRHSQVLLKLDDLGIDFEPQIRALLPEVSRYFGLALPDDFTFEMQMTTHGDGGHFRIHNDNGSPGTASRFLTYVYYFQREPAGFSGGSLRLYDDSPVDPTNWVPVATFKEIKPENNMLLFFPSRHFHEVLPTLSRTGNFADGRFSINGWIRYPQRKAAT
jgi:SM-20-related protein